MLGGIAADRFRDLLLRWLQPFYDNLETHYFFPNTLLITPDLANQDWPSAQTEVKARMQDGQEVALPLPISGIMLRELHCDVVCISGLVARAHDHADFLNACGKDFLDQDAQRRFGDAVAVDQGLQGQGPLGFARGGDDSFLDFHALCLLVVVPGGRSVTKCRGTVNCMWVMNLAHSKASDTFHPEPESYRLRRLKASEGQEMYPFW